MTDRARSERAVDALIRELEDEYGRVPVVEKTWRHSPTGIRAIERRFEENRLGGAGVWVTDEDEQVLLVRNVGDDGWGDPGGKIEAGESFADAARRELREETGVRTVLTGVCDVHVIEHRVEDDDEPVLFESIVVFEGDYVGGTLDPPEKEIAEAAWFSRPPEQVLYEEVRTRTYPADGSVTE